MLIIYSAISGNDTVDFAEWLQYTAIQLLNSQNNDEILKEAFELFDRNQKGHINEEDVLKMIGFMDEQMTLNDAKVLIKESDMDGDGTINFEGRHVFIICPASVAHRQSVGLGIERFWV